MSAEDLVDRLLEYFSRDAGSYWASWLEDSEPPFTVRFRWFAGYAPPEPFASVVSRLEERLRAGYRSGHDSAAEIRWAPEDDMDASVVLVERRKHDQEGLAYEIRLRNSPEAWYGWFSLET